MIPTYRRHCLPSEIPAWDAYRRNRLDELRRSILTFPAFLYYRFINRGVLP